MSLTQMVRILEQIRECYKKGNLDFSTLNWTEYAKLGGIADQQLRKEESKENPEKQLDR